MKLKFSISVKYAIWLSAISLGILSMVIAAVFIILMRGSENLKDQLQEGARDDFRYTQYATVKSLSEYLREYIEPFLYRRDLRELEKLISVLRKNLPIESFVIADPSGEVITDGTGKKMQSGKKLVFNRIKLASEPVITEEIESGYRTVFRVGSGKKPAGFGEIVFSDAPLRRALIRQDITVTFIWQSFMRTILNVLLTGIFLVVLFTIVISIAFSRTFSLPLIRMRGAMKRIAQGDLDFRVKTIAKDEMGDLAMSFNSMVADLQKRTEELAEANMALQLEVAERKRMEEVIRHQAYHDTLTGLPNRVLFVDHLNLALKQARRKNEMVSVIFLDLDRFKNINDSLGHGAGDELLKEVSRRLKGCIREVDTIARIGGDEFTIVVPSISHAEDTIRIVRDLMEMFEKSFSIENHNLHVTASIGISVFPGDGEIDEILLKNADTAMYDAKEKGRNNYQFYDPAMNVRTLERMILETKLRSALEKGELLVYYQPQIEIGTGKLGCVEALIRWQHPELGLIRPDHFIPLAEETGFIVVLDEWVLKTVCFQNRTWRKSGFFVPRISVNLSARHFQQVNLAETVSLVLRETGMNPELLEIEITESTAMRDSVLQKKNLDLLTGLGIKLSIDDFGMGYSSLNYLKKLPIERLKIDKTFISGLPNDPDYKAIINAVIAMAHSLKLKVVAEGVEKEDQLALLREYGCDAVQGYLFGEPLPADDLCRFLKEEEIRLRACP